MPRQSRGRSSAPAPRAAPAPSKAAPPQAQHARAAPAPVPASQQHHNSNVPAAYPQSQGPGIMGQIAANAASVAIGSTMARGLSSALGFGGSSAPAEAPQQAQQVDAYAQQPYQQQQQQQVGQCENIAKDFAKCLSATGNDVAPCQYYLDQFKACQAAAAPY